MAKEDAYSQDREDDDLATSPIVRICKCGSMVYHSLRDGKIHNARDNSRHFCYRTPEQLTEREKLEATPIKIKETTDGRL